MRPRLDRAARLPVAVRGAAAATVATSAATVGHGLAQQSLPSAWIVVVALALATPVCVALAGRRLSLPRLAVAVLLSQLAFHLLLRLDFTGAPSAVTVGPHDMAAMAATITDAAGATGHHDSPAMWVGHALAAVVTVLVLATGEHTVTALIALARRPFRALAPLVAPRSVTPRRLGIAAVGILPSLLLSGVVRRRGPPAVV